MREILFRGKRKQDGEWVEGYYLRKTDPLLESQRHFILHQDSTSGFLSSLYEWNSVDSATVGQYTGLKDKNGKRIFEGDIVESVFTSKPYPVCFGEYTYTDEYGEEECASGWYNEEEGGYKTALACTDVWATVIGNIHDNPELMEGKA